MVRSRHYFFFLPETMIAMTAATTIAPHTPATTGTTGNALPSVLVLSLLSAGLAVAFWGA